MLNIYSYIYTYVRTIKGPGHKLLPQANLHSPNCLLLFQIDLVLSFEELLESLGIRHRFTIRQSNGNYPNVPVTLLPQWCKGRTCDDDIVYADDDEGRSAKVRKCIARWYSKLWITDEYSTSGVKISEAIKPPPVGTLNQ